MKYILIIALTIFSITACTNTHHPTRTESMEDNNTSMKIEDNSETLSIRVKTKNTENPIDYKESFDVRVMNDEQKKELKNHILDSLGLQQIK